MPRDRPSETAVCSAPQDLSTGDTLDDNRRHNGIIGGWISRTPIGAFVVVAATLLVAESLSAWRLIERFPALQPVEPLVESALNLGIVLPVLVFLFVLPSARNLRRREASEAALQAARDQMEARVHERTAELEEFNRRLLRESEDRLGAERAAAFRASLLDAVQQAVVATDGGGRVLYWNRFAEGLYGSKASEATGRGLRELVSFTQEDGQRLGLCDKAGLGDGWSGEVYAAKRDGTRFPVHVSCSPLTGDNQGYLFLSFDISERKQTEEALRDSEAKYSNLVENSPTGVFIFQHGRLVFVNPRFEELLEASEKELLQGDVWSLVHEEDRERVEEIALRRVAGAKLADEYECRLVTRRGKVRWVSMRNALIRYRGHSAILGNVQDLDERKRMEAQLHQLSARLLTIQEEERRRVARDLHDSLGQKLTGIKFLVEAALGKPWPEERRWAILQLRSLIPTIQDLVEELRRISSELRPSILDDLGLLPTMAWHLREFAKAHPDLEVEQRFTAEEAEVPDSLRTPIFRILQEATNNVAKHSGASRLTVDLEAAEGALTLWVRDDGAGFDPAAPRGDPGNGGFGMSSMRERTELSGGAFSVVSGPGKGTTVRAEWPLPPAPPLSG